MGSLWDTSTPLPPIRTTNSNVAEGAVLLSGRVGQLALPPPTVTQGGQQKEATSNGHRLVVNDTLKTAVTKTRWRRIAASTAKYLLGPRLPTAGP